MKITVEDKSDYEAPPPYSFENTVPLAASHANAPPLSSNPLPSIPEPSCPEASELGISLDQSHSYDSDVPLTSNKGYPNENEYSGSIWDSCRDYRTWVGILYLLVFALPFGIVGFVWVWTTLLMSVFLLIIPPVGLIMLSFSFYSIRMLGRFELISQEYLFGRPPLYRGRKDPRVFPEDYLQGRNVIYPTVAGRRWTWWCVLYFTFIKMFIGISVMVSIMLVLGLTLGIICFFPLGLMFVRSVTLWQRDFAFKCLHFE
ncbi:uncharacterized protein VTP21DRAFT_5613 [Calcarisporiella thermophila]|uniref:uncharacterized protein n=1 Tax=Calcarisporiella thermophila TaxID=911321 RepID=UPI0037441438